MALIPGFEHDIFISYAHNDNTRLKGWVDTFVETLKDKLSLHLGEKDRLDVWYDQRRIDGSIDFDLSIKEGIERSAIIICLTSPSYYLSPNCLYELNTFHEKAQAEELGLLFANQSRIINVLLFNIPHEKWDPALKNRTGFKFYESKDKKSIGDPLSVDSTEFTKAQRELRDAIFVLIEKIKQAIDAPEPKPTAVKKTIVKPDGQAIIPPKQPAEIEPVDVLSSKRKINPLFLIAAILLLIVVAAFWWQRPKSNAGASVVKTDSTKTDPIKDESVKPILDKIAIEKLLVHLNDYADSSAIAQTQIVDSVMKNVFAPQFKAIVTGRNNTDGKSYLDYLMVIGKVQKIEILNFRVNDAGKITEIDIKQRLDTE